MTCPPSINPVDFITRVKPLLETRDVHGLLDLLHTRWSYEQIKSLLATKHHDACKVAMLALSLVGGPCCIPTLLQHLKAEDACTNQMAEHALWSIWFRSGSQEANCLLAKGTVAMDEKEFCDAERLFTAAIEADRSFAEAYNQRALVRYLRERYPESIEDCRQTIERMPSHFGAWAGMGHCHAHLGQTIDAIRCYRKALEINPHWESLAETIKALRSQKPSL